MPGFAAAVSDNAAFKGPAGAIQLPYDDGLKEYYSGSLAADDVAVGATYDLKKFDDGSETLSLSGVAVMPGSLDLTSGPDFTSPATSTSASELAFSWTPQADADYVYASVFAEQDMEDGSVGIYDTHACVVPMTDGSLAFPADAWNSLATEKADHWTIWIGAVQIVDVPLPGRQEVSRMAGIRTWTGEFPMK